MIEDRLSPLAELQSTATKALRHYLRPDGRETADLKTVAVSFVEARAHFYTRDGSPDWTGRSHAYRSWVREIMSEAGVPAEDVASVQAAIRYHVGAALRDKLNSEELQDLGLRSDTPRERSAQKRERINETLNLVAGGHAITDAEEILAALTVIEATLRRIEGKIEPSSAEALNRIERLTGGLLARR